MEIVTIMLIALLITQGAVLALVLFFGRKDRMKLVEMLAARNYSEFVSMSGKDKDSRSNRIRNHKNMVIEQQEKMIPKRE